MSVAAILGGVFSLSFMPVLIYDFYSTMSIAKKIEKYCGFSGDLSWILADVIFRYNNNLNLYKNTIDILAQNRIHDLETIEKVFIIAEKFFLKQAKEHEVKLDIALIKLSKKLDKYCVNNKSAEDIFTRLLKFVIQQKNIQLQSNSKSISVDSVKLYALANELWILLEEYQKIPKVLSDQELTDLIIKIKEVLDDCEKF